ncbi:DUF4388 domain-containing protein [Desulfobacterales bacterium HSG2]|nr:DUF4388 domain-containing protein [Desulfobacterales bacterium HSG2]
MNLLEASFKIVEDNSCPLYELGDEFKLSGDTLLLPYDKDACLILIENIKKFIADDLPEISYVVNYSKDVFNCGGCTGLIILACEAVPAESIRKTRRNTDTKEEHDIDTIASLLSDFSFFQTLNEKDIRDLVSLLKLKKFINDEFIIKKGDPGTNLYIILFGKIEVLGDDGISIAFLGKGEVFGEMSLLSGDPVGATIKVVEPTTILYINGKDFRNAFTRFPSLQMYFARLLARRLAKTNIVRSEEYGSGMVGKLSEMPPSELFQLLNTNQKTGVLTLDLPEGSADLSFRDGGLISAKYNNEENEEAFYEILKEKEGRFKFTPGLPPEAMKADELGDFMWLLMEGIRRMEADAN